MTPDLLTNDQKNAVYDYYLRKETAKREREYALFKNAWGVTVPHTVYVRTEIKTETLESLKAESVLAVLQNKLDAKTPETVSIKLTPNIPTDENWWVEDAGIDVTTVKLVKTFESIEKQADSSLRWFANDYTWKAIHQPNGKDVKAHNKFLDSLNVETEEEGISP